MKTKIYILAVAGSMTVVAAAALVVDAGELKARVQYWNEIVGNEIMPGTSRDAVERWLKTHSLIANPGGTQILFDQSGRWHRPQRYWVPLETVRQLWPRALSLCSPPVVELEIAFDPQDRVATAVVTAHSMSCL